MRRISPGEGAKCIDFNAEAIVWRTYRKRSAGNRRVLYLLKVYGRITEVLLRAKTKSSHFITLRRRFMERPGGIMFSVSANFLAHIELELGRGLHLHTIRNLDDERAESFCWPNWTLIKHVRAYLLRITKALGSERAHVLAPEKQHNSNNKNKRPPVVRALSNKTGRIKPRTDEEKGEENQSLVVIGSFSGGLEIALIASAKRDVGTLKATLS